MKVIPLTRGYVTLVDDEDYEWLSKFKWHVVFSRGKYYAARVYEVHGSKKRMHREIIYDMKGCKIIDHKDGNGLNNQKSNLRPCTISQNQFNRKLNKNSKTGYTGIYKEGRLWVAYVYYDKKGHRVHSSIDIMESIKHRNEWIKKNRGEFAMLAEI